MQLCRIWRAKQKGGIIDDNIPLAVGCILTTIETTCAQINIPWALKGYYLQQHKQHLRFLLKIARFPR